MTEETIGGNIRTRREQAGLTLTELAARAGLTKGALSKIETGRGSAAIATILRIAEALGIPLAELFADSEQSAPYVLTRSGQGKILTRDGSRFGYSYEALALDMKHKAAEPFLLTIQPGDPQGEFHHHGQEFIYMLSGQMEFTIGDDLLRLGRGDSLYFDSAILHSTRILGKRPAQFLCLFIQENKPATSPRSQRRKT
jgi:transcriptional regulator with XRE-family HTH domain